jgi:hypothetical protein
MAETVAETLLTKMAFACELDDVTDPVISNRRLLQ